MVRQNSRMQHIRISEHHMPALPNRPPRIPRRIPIVSKHPKRFRKPRTQIMQLRKLVLRQRLGRKNIKRPSIRILKNRIQNRQVVTNSLPGSGRRNHHNVLPTPHRLSSRSLMRIKPRNPLRPVRRQKLRPHPSRHINKRSLPGREVLNSRKHLPSKVAFSEYFNRLAHSLKRSSPPHSQSLSHKSLQPDERPSPKESSLFVR